MVPHFIPSFVQIHSGWKVITEKPIAQWHHASGASPTKKIEFHHLYRPCVVFYIIMNFILLSPKF